MGHQTLVYGNVLLFRSREKSCLEADAINEAALRSLPDTDEWPFLVRSMFSITENPNVSVEYAYRVLHFGASYKEIEFEWDQWLQKFERFLSKLYGLTATVHLESEIFGEYTYEWNRSVPKNPWEPEVWQFQGGQRSFGWEKR